MLDLRDKTILVSTRKIDERGSEETETFFGRVVSFNESSVVLSRAGAGAITMPYDEDVIEVAEAGFYELNDGTTHENPDFIARWVVYASQAARDRFAGSRNR
jgi:hypothetical protein